MLNIKGKWQKYKQIGRNAIIMCVAFHYQNIRPYSES